MHTPFLAVLGRYHRLAITDRSDDACAFTVVVGVGIVILKLLGLRTG
jgi:hypothetical protein